MNKFSLLLVGILTTTSVLVVKGDVGDGRCEKNLNNKQNNYDGGDCNKFNKKYPGCKGRDPWRVGDGVCDNWGGHATSKCKRDGGDCIVKGYPKCDVPNPQWIGDGICQSTHMNPSRLSEYNSKECGWDGGDCLFPGTYPKCPIKRMRDANHLGDSICDVDLNIKNCGYDAKDCRAFFKEYPNCKTKRATNIGNGLCDEEDNNEACGFDGGDCDTQNAPTGCADSPFKARIKRKDGKVIWKDCGWVAMVYTEGRCKMPGIPSHCKETCGQCDSHPTGLFDSTATFRYWSGYNTRMVEGSCDFHGTVLCKYPGFLQTCRDKCSWLIDD